MQQPGSTGDSSGAPPVVELRDVTLAYGTRPVLRGVSVTVSRGEALVLVGRSGVGKSTLLKLVNGMLMPMSGEVLVEGRDTREWDLIALRRRIGYVLQHIGLFPHMTVADNVTLVPRLQGWDAGRRAVRAAELLDLVGLAPSEYATRWPHELSGGQQQRVGVARALAASPPVLLLDEPFGALDAVTRADLQRMIGRVRASLATSLIMVTHDIGEAGTVASRIGVLDDGALVICDTPAAVWRSTDPRVRRLLDAVPASPVDDTASHADTASRRAD